MKKQLIILSIALALIGCTKTETINVYEPAPIPAPTVEDYHGTYEVIGYYTNYGFILQDGYSITLNPDGTASKVGRDDKEWTYEVFDTTRDLQQEEDEVYNVRLSSGGVVTYNFEIVLMNRRPYYTDLADGKYWVIRDYGQNNQITIYVKL
tara:strand:+ start:1959 stop:2411 length:453 start_codon:yes stop_codon:yes gene_type:complete